MGASVYTFIGRFMGPFVGSAPHPKETNLENKNITGPIFILILLFAGVLTGNTIRATGPASLRGKWHSERSSERASEKPLKISENL